MRETTKAIEEKIDRPFVRPCLVKVAPSMQK